MLTTLITIRLIIALVALLALGYVAINSIVTYGINVVGVLILLMAILGLIAVGINFIILC